MSPSRLTMVAFACSTLACAPAGTRPHDMSTAAHVAAADAEEREAEQHSDEAADGTGHAVHCGSPASGALLGSPCWTEEEHPSEDHTAAMEEHRRLAAAHRAAADALRQAEARACVGLTDDERDASPFEHREDIASVAELHEDVQVGRTVTRQLAGATITFRAVRGLTAEWLERVIECHLARNASLGHDVPEMPDCPLVPMGVSAQARSTGDGFAVDIRADTREGAEEILRRARSLTAAR